MKIKHTNPDGSVVDVDVGFCFTIGVACTIGAGCKIGDGCELIYDQCVIGVRTYPWTAWLDHGIPQFRFGCEQHPLADWTAEKCAELSAKHGAQADDDRDMVIAMVRAWAAWHAERAKEAKA